MLVALTDAPWKSLAVLGLYIFIQQLESSVFTPLVMSRQVSLLPALTLIAQITSAFFFGVLGLFLAVPFGGHPAGVDPGGADSRCAGSLARPASPPLAPV
jgi:predicted PurR-regulated permease PerM